MAKTPVTYWNPLKPENHSKWLAINCMENMDEELTLAMDESTGDYTRLTRFKPGADTTAYGGKITLIPKRSWCGRAGFMMQPSTDGSRPATMQADRPGNFTARSEQKPVAWCWKCPAPASRLNKE